MGIAIKTSQVMTSHDVNVLCHVVFDNPDWSKKRVQIVCTLVCADTIYPTAAMINCTTKLGSVTRR